LLRIPNILYDNDFKNNGVIFMINSKDLILPKGIELSKLPGAQWGEYDPTWCPAKIFWNELRIKFVIVSGITEVSMCNNMGLICWGAVENEKVVSLTTPSALACCCYGDILTWLDNDTFAFKTSAYDDKTEKVAKPIIIVGFDIGYFVDLESDKEMIASEKGGWDFDVWEKPNKEVPLRHYSDHELRAEVLQTKLPKRPESVVAKYEVK
jgi:hypothetical protein